MAQFKEEKLIPLLRVTRKLLSCDVEQRLNALQQIDQIFRSHEMSFSLMNIVVSGLCSFFERIPKTVYAEIESIMPSDKQLNLKDSVYESRLVNTEEKSNEDETEQSINKEILPLTLLRIPTDLQCHLFNFLNVEELTGVQAACRALCIAARNPSSLYCLQVPSQHLGHGILKEVYSRPKRLEISAQPGQPLICNAKWGEHVTNLSIINSETWNGEINLDYYPSFRRLQQCTIQNMPSILLNGNIVSYDTLNELSLIEIELTEDIIVETQKFENLKKLSIACLRPNSDRRISLDPISLPKLKELSYGIVHFRQFRNFRRILIGSHPETINVDTLFFTLGNAGIQRFNAYIQGDDFILNAPKVPAIKQVNINWKDRRTDGTQWFAAELSQWIRVSHCVGSNLFDESKVALNLNIRSPVMDRAASDIITLFRCSRTSKLKLFCYPHTLSDCNVSSFINRILNAPKGTFDEIEVEIGCHPMYDTDDRMSMERLANVIKSNHNETLHDIFKNRVGKAEDWLTPWLVFDEERMKRIGLRRLDITFLCDLNIPPPDHIIMNSARIKGVLENLVGSWSKKRAARWNNMVRKCIKSTVTKGRAYTVTFSSHV